MASGPGVLAMSVVVVTPSAFDAVRRTVEHLAAQTVASRLEVILVAPRAEGIELDEGLLRAFASWRLLELGSGFGLAPALAAGIRAASAPMVTYAEEHAFPEPEWAEALLERHRGPWAAVGATILNGSPPSVASVADHLLSHGRFGPGAGGEMDELPGHNTAYKRDLLLALGDGLETAMVAETALHWQLHARGERLYLEPRARTRHLSATTIRRWLPVRFHRARLFGASRSRSWTTARRLAYVAGAPLIPPLRLWRLLRALPRGLATEGLGRALPVVLVALVVEAAGEAAGYLAGVGASPRRVSAYELERATYISTSDPT